MVTYAERDSACAGAARASNPKMIRPERIAASLFRAKLALSASLRKLWKRRTAPMALAAAGAYRERIASATPNWRNTPRYFALRATCFADPPTGRRFSVHLLVRASRRGLARCLLWGTQFLTRKLRPCAVRRLLPGDAGR